MSSESNLFNLSRSMNGELRFVKGLKKGHGIGERVVEIKKTS
jgi:hypothetical protein